MLSNLGPIPARLQLAKFNDLYLDKYINKGIDMYIHKYFQVHKLIFNSLEFKDSITLTPFFAMVELLSLPF